MPLKYVRLLFFFACLFVLGWFLSAIKPILLPFVFGMLIAYLFDPLADKLEKRGVSRTLATAIVLFCFFSILTLAMVLLVPPLITQVTSLLTALPAKLTQLEHQAVPWANHLMRKIGLFNMDDLQQSAGDMSTAAAGDVRRRCGGGR